LGGGRRRHCALASLQHLFELLIAELQLLDSAGELTDLCLDTVKAHTQIGRADLGECLGLCLRR
jgi:hypothetical protein